MKKTVKFAVSGCWSLATWRDDGHLRRGQDIGVVEIEPGLGIQLAPGAAGIEPHYRVAVLHRIPAEQEGEALAGLLRQRQILGQIAQRLAFLSVNQEAVRLGL